MAAQAVRDKRYRQVWLFFQLVLHHVFQARDPVATQRVHPVVLLYQLVAEQLCPTYLPMLRPAALPAWECENVW